MVGDVFYRLQRIIQSPTSSLVEDKGELGVAKGGTVANAGQRTGRRVGVVGVSGDWSAHKMHDIS